MSAVNVQLETLIKVLEPKSVPLKNPPNPKEFECLGFKLTDFNILFRKSYAEVVCSYEPVDEPSDPAYCEDFAMAMRNGPDALIKNAKQFYENINAADDDDNDHQQDDSNALPIHDEQPEVIEQAEEVVAHNEDL